jgi:hypothetical protein
MRVALILNVESHVLNLVYGLFELGIFIAEEYTIVHVDHEDDVTMKEDTVIDQ